MSSNRPATECRLGRKTAAPVPATLPLPLHSLSESCSANATSPAGFSYKPLLRIESPLNGKSTARTPTGAPARPDSRGAWGAHLRTPRAQPSHERIQGQTFGGQILGANFRGNVRGPGRTSGGAGRRWSSSGRSVKKPIAAATFDTHGCVGGFRCGWGVVI